MHSEPRIICRAVNDSGFKAESERCTRRTKAGCEPDDNEELVFRIRARVIVQALTEDFRQIPGLVQIGY